MKLWPLPTVSKIGAHIYKIVYPYHFEKTPNGKYHGMVRTNQQEIRIDSQDIHGELIHPLCSIVSYWHEIIHEIDELAGSHVFNDGTRETEDKLDAFVELLLAFLVDNGHLENTWDNG